MMKTNRGVTQMSRTSVQLGLIKVQLGHVKVSCIYKSKVSCLRKEKTARLTNFQPASSVPALQAMCQPTWVIQFYGRWMPGARMNKTRSVSTRRRRRGPASGISRHFISPEAAQTRAVAGPAASASENTQWLGGSRAVAQPRRHGARVLVWSLARGE